MNLPPEVRNNVYEYVFTPFSSNDIHTSSHSTTLTLAWIEPESVTDIKFCKHPGLHFSRPAEYQFLFTSKQVYAEALSILTRKTSLRISGAPYHYLRRTIDRAGLHYLDELQSSIAHHTPHLILDQDALKLDDALVDAIADRTLFPKLRKLTQYHCGPAQLSNSWPPLALSSKDARKLVAEHKWPSKMLQDFFSLEAGLGPVPQEVNGELAAVVSPLFPTILQSLRNRLDNRKPKHEFQNSRAGDVAIEVVWTLKLKGLFTTLAPCRHMLLDKAVSIPFPLLSFKPALQCILDQFINKSEIRKLQSILQPVKSPV